MSRSRAVYPRPSRSSHNVHEDLVYSMDDDEHRAEFLDFNVAPGEQAGMSASFKGFRSAV